MKKLLIIFGVLVILGGAGAAGYFFWYQDNEDSQQSQISEETQEVEATAFNPLATEGEAFVATITTKQNGEVSEATVSFDGQGKSEHTATSQGQTVRTVYTEDAFYTCNDAQGCFKFDLAQSSGTNTDPEQYQFEAGDIEDYSATATNEGQKPCDGGTCEVWVSSSFQNQGKTTVYIDTETNRIVKIESTFDGVENTITYQYKDVKISVPKNAEKLPAGI